LEFDTDITIGISSRCNNPTLGFTIGIEPLCRFLKSVS
jgi:hypothetical protein